MENNGKTLEISVDVAVFSALMQRAQTTRSRITWAVRDLAWERSTTADRWAENESKQSDGTGGTGRSQANKSAEQSDGREEKEGQIGRGK